MFGVPHYGPPPPPGFYGPHFGPPPPPIYGRPVAISVISFGTSCPLNPVTKSLTGIDEINISPSIISVFPFTSHSTD